MIKVKRSAFLILILSVSAAWAFASGTHEKSSAMSGPSMSGNTMQPAGAMSSNTAMQPTGTRHGAGNSMSSAVTMSFTSLRDAEMYASSGPTLLYFCSKGDSACQSTVKILDSGTAKLPADAHVFVVDYSKASDLRMRYNVRMDDTFVKIGPMGQPEMMWSGGGAGGVRMHLSKE